MVAVAGAPEVAVGGGPVFEDFNLLRAAALAGQGVALCPIAMIADDIREGRLTQLSATAIGGEFAYYVVAAGPAALGAPPVAAVRDWLLSTAPAA
jgi:DNA-binding transcriptional LysR family regulator